MVRGSGSVVTIAAYTWAIASAQVCVCMWLVAPRGQQVSPYRPVQKYIAM